VIEVIFEPLLYVLKYAVEQSDFVLEIQLLQLFKLILVKVRYFSDDNRDRVGTLLANMLLPTLIEGLQSKFPYVREQIISFVSTNIPIFSELFKPDLLQKTVQEVLLAYLGLFKKTFSEIKDYEEKNTHPLINVTEGIQKVS
jgi:hypothetical protein